MCTLQIRYPASINVRTHATVQAAGGKGRIEIDTHYKDFVQDSFCCLRYQQTILYHVAMTFFLQYFQSPIQCPCLTCLQNFSPPSKRCTARWSHQEALMPQERWLMNQDSLTQPRLHQPGLSSRPCTASYWRCFLYSCYTIQLKKNEESKNGSSVS